MEVHSSLRARQPLTPLRMSPLPPALRAEIHRGGVILLFFQTETVLQPPSGSFVEAQAAALYFETGLRAAPACQDGKLVVEEECISHNAFHVTRSRT